MRRKSIVILALVLVLSIFITACAKDDVDKTPENPTVNDVDALENLDQDADSPEDSGDDQVDEGDWPKDFMTEVPVLEGEINSIEEREENHLYMTFEFIEHDLALDYVENLKEAGFTNKVEENIADHIVKYTASDENNNTVKFHWSTSGRSGLALIKE